MAVEWMNELTFFFMEHNEYLLIHNRNVSTNAMMIEVSMPQGPLVCTVPWNSCGLFY